MKIKGKAKQGSKDQFILAQLWKEGKYDEAVLDVMGLKWDGDVILGNRGFE